MTTNEGGSLFNVSLPKDVLNEVENEKHLKGPKDSKKQNKVFILKGANKRKIKLVEGRDMHMSRFTEKILASSKFSQ